ALAVDHLLHLRADHTGRRAGRQDHLRPPGHGREVCGPLPRGPGADPARGHPEGTPVAPTGHHIQGAVWDAGEKTPVTDPACVGASSPRLTLPHAFLLAPSHLATSSTE